MSSMSRVHLLIQQERYDLAEKELRGILASDPDQAEPHSLLAICLMVDQSRWNEATEEAQQGVRLEPDEPFVHATLGYVLLQRNRTREARESAKTAISLDPYDADNFSLLSKIEFADRQWNQALEAANNGLRIDPENENCQNLRSIALERLGRPDEAVQSARDALAKSPGNSMTHASLGWAALGKGDYRQAQESFREALRLDPNNEIARDGMIDALNSRSILFRTVNGFHIWLSRFAGKYQMLMIFGSWFLIQYLDRLGQRNPALSLITFPLIIVYNALVVLMLISTPLFNTFLRFNTFGRHLLNRKEIWSSNLIAVCLITSLASGLYVAIQGGRWLVYSGYWLVMLIPVATTMTHETKKRLFLFALASTVVGLIPVIGVAKSLAANSWDPMGYHVAIFIWSTVGIQIASNIVHQRPVRN